MSSTIKRIDCDGAEDFLDVICPRKGIFKNLPLSARVLYRGQGSSSWKLIPSALRPEFRQELHALAGTSVMFENKDCHIAQMIAELRILSFFEKELDRQGLEVPRTEVGSVFELLAHYENDFKCGQNHTAPSGFALLQFQNLMSLAQHYGLPTRLLDWTTSSWTAAYFAATQGLASTAHSFADRASVWALHSPVDYITATGDHHNLRILKIPRSVNANLRSQDGMLTMHTFDGMRVKNDSAIYSASIESSIVHVNDSDRYGPDHIFLYHMTVPHSELGKVLWWLRKAGIYGSQLFPGHYGAARSAREETLYQDPYSR